MTLRNFEVSHQKDRGFELRMYEESALRRGVLAVADWIDVLSGHRLCNSKMHNAAWNWSIASEKSLLTVPITREQADALAWSEDQWSWLDDDEEEEVTEVGA